MGYLKNQHDGRKVKKALAVKLSYQGYGFDILPRLKPEDS
jgi:hypothetical protein